MSSNVTLRIPKGSKLSYEEGDNNFKDIQKLFRFTEDTPTAAGTADALTLTSFVRPLDGLVDNMWVGFKASLTNITTTPTIDVDGTGAVVIERGTGSPLQAGDITSGLFYVVRYNQASNTYRLFGQGGGVDEFIELIDTPASYSGAGGQAVAVNVGETGLEFVAFPSAPVDSVNGQTGVVVLDYGDFAGAENIILDTDIALFGQDTASQNRHLISIRSSPAGLLLIGNSVSQVRVHSLAVPQANYGGNTYDLITTEGNQVIAGGLTLEGPLNINAATSIPLVINRQSAGIVNVQFRNDVAGVGFDLSVSGNVSIQQRDFDGGNVKNLASFTRDGSSSLYNNGVITFSTEASATTTISATSPGIGAGQTAQHIFRDASFAPLGRMGFGSTPDFDIVSNNHGGSVVIGAEDTGGTLRTLATLDPDADITLSPVGNVVIDGATWPSANAVGVLNNDGAGNLTWASAGGQVDSVVGGDNITVDATDPANPIVDLDNFQDFTTSFEAGVNSNTFLLVTSDTTQLAAPGFTPSISFNDTTNVLAMNLDPSVAGSGNIITGRGNVLSFNDDGTNTSVALQHNGSDVLTVDENGLLIDNAPMGSMFFDALDIQSGSTISISAHAPGASVPIANLTAHSNTGNSAFAQFSATGLPTAARAEIIVGEFSVTDHSVLQASWDGTDSILSLQYNSVEALSIGSFGIFTENVNHGFFGATPVAQQTIDSSDTDANRIAALEAALEAYGLVVDTAP